MANYIKNKLIIQSDSEKGAIEVAESLKGVIYEGEWEQDLCFNKIIPVPDNITDEMMNKYNCKAVEAVRYWVTDNWGSTEAISPNVRISGKNIIADFESTNKCPINILKEIAKQNPDCNLICYYADEDRGYNCGKWILGDSVTNEEVKGGSAKGYAYYMALWNETMKKWANEENMKLSDYYKMLGIDSKEYNNELKKIKNKIGRTETRQIER